MDEEFSAATFQDDLKVLISIYRDYLSEGDRSIMAICLRGEAAILEGLGP